jgi:hypothetical protein
MSTFYNFRQNGVDYSFDDVFVPAEMFRDGNLWTWGNSNNVRLGITMQQGLEALQSPHLLEEPTGKK